jgi:hypothetical protein
MTDAPVATTFDIADLFTGQALPKTDVDIWLDAKSAYEIYKNAKEIKDAVFRQDTEKLGALEARHHELLEKAKSSRVTFKLTASLREDRQAVLEKTLEKYPQEFNFLGQAKPNREADEYHANLMWALHTEAIVRPDGSAIAAPGPEQIAYFRGHAPDAAVLAIEEALKEFTDGAASGFDTVAMETGFLSQP